MLLCVHFAECTQRWKPWLSLTALSPALSAWCRLHARCWARASTTPMGQTTSCLCCSWPCLASTPTISRKHWSVLTGLRKVHSFPSSSSRIRSKFAGRPSLWLGERGLAFIVDSVFWNQWTPNFSACKTYTMNRKTTRWAKLVCVDVLFFLYNPTPCNTGGIS